MCEWKHFVVHFIVDQKGSWNRRGSQNNGRNEVYIGLRIVMKMNWGYFKPRRRREKIKSLGEIDLLYFILLPVNIKGLDAVSIFPKSKHCFPRPSILFASNYNIRVRLHGR